MRRDLCYFYPLPVEPVFDAFVNAANQKFGKQCRIDAYKTINFGLNYSFKYNMNGGSLTIHFMPYNNGTAIDMRYSMAQLMGGRYRKHAEDVLIFVNAQIGAQAQPIELDVNQFLAYEAGVPAAPMNVAAPSAQQPVRQPIQQSAPIQQPAPAQQPMPQPAQPTVQPAPQRNFCPNCGARVVPNARFCANCGGKLI